jgi:hypothetical protein
MEKMTLADGFILSAVIMCIGCIAMVSFMLWVRSRCSDETVTKTEHVTPADGNIFEDMGFEPEEAARLLEDSQGRIAEKLIRENETWNKEARKIIEDKLGITEIETVTLTKRESLRLLELLENLSKKIGENI